MAPPLCELPADQGLRRCEERTSVLSCQRGEGCELIHSVLVWPNGIRVHERQSLSRGKKSGVAGAALIEQTVEELGIGEVGEVFRIAHGTREGQPQSGIAAGEFGDPLAVHAAEPGETPGDQRFNDLVALRVDSNHGGDFRPVLPNVVFDRDEADLGGRGRFGGEKVVRVDGTVVQNKDGGAVLRREPRQHGARSRNRVGAHIGVYGQACIKRIGPDGLLEQGLDEAGFSDAREPHDAQGPIRGSNQASNFFYPVYDFEGGSVSPREDDMEAGFAYQIIGIAGRSDSPTPVGLPAVERNAKRVPRPKLHARMLREPVRELAAPVELRPHVTEGTNLVELMAHSVVANRCRISGGIVVQADDHVAAIRGGELREDGAKPARWGHLSVDPRGRHTRLLDLKAGSRAGHEVTGKSVEFDAAVNIQAAIGSGMGTGPPDCADRRPRSAKLRLAQTRDEFAQIGVTQLPELISGDIEHFF